MRDLGAILTAMVTPFDEDGAVDEPAAVALGHHLLDHGSDGLVVAATTGEATTLDDREHLALVELIVNECGERASAIVAGTGSNDTRHAVELTERGAALGVDAVLSVTPYYNRPSPRGILAHFTEVARAAGETPVLLYNIPTRTGVDMPNELLARLAQIDGIDGVKQANHANLAPVDGLAIYAGNDDMLRDVLDLGEPGGICVASHIAGEQMHAMVDEPDRRDAIHDSLTDLFATLFLTASPTPTKAALALLGHRVGDPRLPIVPATDEEREQIRAMLVRYGLLEDAPPAS